MDSHSEQSIKLMYLDGYGSSVIGNVLGISKDTVSYTIRKLGIARSRLGAITKYDIDDRFFDTIDSPEKAYFLGWLFSDGSISGHTIRISLKADDGNLLVLSKLNKIIKSNRPIKTYTDKLGYKRVVLSISNKNLSCSLKTLGMNGNKTFNCHYPNIPDFLDSHFIRGYFDGDGSLSRFKDLRFVYGLVGTTDFLEGMKVVLDRNHIHSNISKEFCDSQLKVKRLHIFRIRDIERIGEFMYYNCGEFFLSRKRDRFEEFLFHRISVENSKCKAIGCDKKTFRNGLCHEHLFAKKRLDNPLYTRSSKISVTVVENYLTSGMTQREIAKTIGVSPSALCKFLQRRSTPLLSAVPSSRAS